MLLKQTICLFVFFFPLNTVIYSTNHWPSDRSIIVYTTRAVIFLFDEIYISILKLEYVTGFLIIHEIGDCCDQNGIRPIGLILSDYDRENAHTIAVK